MLHYIQPLDVVSVQVPTLHDRSLSSNDSSANTYVDSESSSDILQTQCDSYLIISIIHTSNIESTN